MHESSSPEKPTPRSESKSPGLYTGEILEAVTRWSGTFGPPNRWSRRFPKGLRMLRSGVLERTVGTAHPITPGIWFGPLIAYGIYHGVWHLGIIATGGVLLCGAWGIPRPD